MTTLQQIGEIINEVGYPVSIPITGKTRLEKDLAFDSMDRVELIMAIELHWNIEIDDESAWGAQTIGDLVNIIDRLKSK